MKEIKQSETRVIFRSQINLNPINPKRHPDEKVKLQKKNIQKVGFLGGIVWNKVTKNLIDGHRRIKAMDLYYEYDGTPETDYEVKVEVVFFDEKTEKEQVTYMAVGNTKADIDLIAVYIADIDYSELGLSNLELNDILSISNIETPKIESIDELLNIGTNKDTVKEEKSYEEKKAKMKEVKQNVKDVAIERRMNEDSFITLSFSTHEALSGFCDLLGCSIADKYIKGEDVLKLIE